VCGLMSFAPRLHWIVRYAILGAVFGFCAGSVLPVLGNLLGLVVGVPFGGALGLVAAAGDIAASDDPSARLHRARVWVTAVVVPLAIFLTIVSRNNIWAWPAVLSVACAHVAGRSARARSAVARRRARCDPVGAARAAACHIRGRCRRSQPQLTGPRLICCLDGKRTRHIASA
jgi:hypothetical protein